MLLPPAGPDNVRLAWREETVRQSHGFDLRVRIACASCNNGWLNDVEGEFRAAMIAAITGRASLPGEELLLDAQAQRVSSVWAVKTWLLMEMALRHIRGTANTSASVLRYLYERRQPPVDIHVFVGTVSPAVADFGGFRTVLLKKESEPPVAVIALMLVGKVAFVIYAPTGTFRVGTTRGIQFEGELAGALAQTWPPKTEAVRWPTSAVLTSAAIARLLPESGVFPF